MSEIRVDVDSLEGGQTGIMATHSRLVGTLDDLEADLQPMLATWDGEAREAHFRCKQEWDAAAEQMSTTLQQIVQLVGDAQHSDTAAERSATSTWS